MELLGRKSEEPRGDATTPRSRQLAHRRVWRLVPSNATGLVGALVFFAASLTPSLIPRTWLFQAAVTGVSMATGYAVGVTVAWLAHLVGIGISLTERGRRIGWLAFGAVALVTVVTFMVLGARWQSRLRALFGMDDVAPAYVLVFVGAVLLALVLVLIGRGLHALIKKLARRLDRWTHTTVAHAVSAALVLALTAFLVNGTVVRYFMNWMDTVYAAIDESTAEGVVVPTDPLRSGSPESLVEWDDLGYQGRTFVGTGPTEDELTTFARERGLDALDVKTPVRVYSGLESADDLGKSAALVVEELDRTNAWDRDVLVVVTATGTGWVDPGMSDSLELMHGGDTAIASMQYSYLPSWVSFVANKQLPPVAGKELFDAVYAAWSQQPANDRPELYVFGESLGSYGGQDAFSGRQDMSERTDGALWVGTPNQAANWQYFTEKRDAGSYASAPTFERGAQVRWSVAADDARDLWDLGEQWDEPRIAYVQHPSDAVTWWSTDLIWHEPDWLREPPGHDVLEELRWWPGVTFWQLTADIMHAADVPAGHGHKYWFEYLDAWAAVTSPSGWTDRDRDLLYDAMRERAIAEEVEITGTEPCVGLAPCSDG